ncbi:RICIN domain-containing protein [Mucilaginibacter angelicae]|uniref:RICIN domain-containing protein n=1 Tax=Mucilaginibacter angelicae TaxID=869718 RepID=A0ABV6L135_9SPHI
MKHLLNFLLLFLLLTAAGCSKKEAPKPVDNHTDTDPPKTEQVYGSLKDTNIRYFGRWDFSNKDQYVSYWGGAYIKVDFTGTTVKVKVGNTSDFYAKIDNGPWISYKQSSGIINLTPTPLTNGTHSLSVAQGKDYDYQFKFDGLVLDNNAVTKTPAVMSSLIEYIGDSITAGYTCDQANVSDYAWVASEALGAEHTQIAFPGIKLTSGFPDVGMDVQYLKMQSDQTKSQTGDWNFQGYTPKLVVINLGTNDNNGVPDEEFQKAYVNLLTTVRAKFPDAEIFALRTFLGVKSSGTLAAVVTRMAAGDLKVHYIDTDGWLKSGDYSDGIHPNAAGHIKAAALLKPILEPYLNGTPPPVPLPDGTYKIINRNSKLAMDVKGALTESGTPITQWTYGGGDNQRWTMTHIGAGVYKIIGVQSGRALQIENKSPAAGAALQIGDYSGSNDQKFIISKNAEGYYTITSLLSGKVVEVGGQSDAPGASIDVWDNNGGIHQQWSFEAP